MRSLQYVGQVWHAVVSWSDFPSRECLRPELSAIRPVRHPVVSSLKGRLKIRKQPAQKDYPEYLSHFLCGIFCMTSVTIQKNVLYSYAQRSFYVIFFKIYF